METAAEVETEEQTTEGVDTEGAGTSSAEEAPERQKPRKARMVTLDEHIKLRRRAQEAEAERERLRVETEVLRRERQAPAKEAEAELTDDALWAAGGPAKFINQTAANARKAAAEAEFNALTRMSRAQAKRNHADYLEKEAYWRANAPDSMRQAVTSEDDPCEFAYEWAKSRMDPPKTDEEREAEMTARVIEKLRAKGIEIPADEEPEIAPKKKPTLRSIAGNRNAQGETAQVRNLTAVEAARKVQHGKF